MLRRFAIFFLLGLSIFVALPAAQNKAPLADTKGTISGENTYHNPALGMTIVLAGPWEFFEEDAQRKAGVYVESKDNDSPCRAPFCDEDIKVAIASKPFPGPYVIYLTAFKLSAPYLDRKRYPLVKFAKAMTVNVLGGTGWTIFEGLTPIKLAGKTVYRLLLRQPEPAGFHAWGLAYVGESNGYVFLMIGNAVDF